MGDKAMLNGTGIGIWKGSKGAMISLINPPAAMNAKDVLTQMGGEVAARM